MKFRSALLSAGFLLSALSLPALSQDGASSGKTEAELEAIVVEFMEINNCKILDKDEADKKALEVFPAKGVTKDEMVDTVQSMFERGILTGSNDSDPLEMPSGCS